ILGKAGLCSAFERSSTEQRLWRSGVCHPPSPIFPKTIYFVYRKPFFFFFMQISFCKKKITKEFHYPPPAAVFNTVHVLSRRLLIDIWKKLAGVRIATPDCHMSVLQVVSNRGHAVERAT